MAYKIIQNENVPDDTYFNASEVMPTRQGQSITIFNGHGRSRSWGRPQVTSTVVVNRGAFAAIHVGFSHKHRGGQQWYYFVAGERKTWAQLSDKQQRQVRKVFDAGTLPGWIKQPGKLDSERINPAIPTIAYKLVGVNEAGEFVSLFDGTTVYRIGEMLTQKAIEGHNGGYYSYPTVDLAVKFAYTNLGSQFRECAVLECEISGKRIPYPNGKWASTHIKPIRLIRTFNRDLAHEVSLA